MALPKSGNSKQDQDRMNARNSPERVSSPTSSLLNSMDIADTGVGDDKSMGSAEAEAPHKERPKKELPTTKIIIPRPLIKRNMSQPPPPQHPLPAPDPPPDQSPASATDSLSLVQLKRIITDMPKWEPTAYAFAYDDAASFKEELEEWFSYSDKERLVLVKTREAFESAWSAFLASEMPDTLVSVRWTSVESETRRMFVVKQMSALKSPLFQDRASSVETLLYLTLGVWVETANSRNKEKGDDLQPTQDPSESQLAWIMNNSVLIHECGGLQTIYDVLKDVCLRHW